MAQSDQDELRRNLNDLAAHYGGGRTVEALREGYTELLEELLETAQDEIGRKGTLATLRSALVRAGLDEEGG
jgi:hypothetical protein